MSTRRVDYEDMNVRDEELTSGTERLRSRASGSASPPPFSNRYPLSAPQPSQLCEGEVVAHNYYVSRVIGKDGLAIVARVRHVELGRSYLLKYLPPEHCVYPEVVARFLRGVRAAQGLASEHTARIVDAGRLESGAPYVVSEFLSGVPLREMVGARGALSVTDTVDYVLQACESIAEAHSNRLVHKSLSLSRLFMTQRPDGAAFVKVLDFGVADAVRADPLASESVRDSLGLGYQVGPYTDSLVCAAPEQVRNSRDIDVHVDIWAVGCILHELLTGAPVYQADSAAGLLAMIVADPPVALRALRSDVPPELEAVVLHCLEKDPASRYPSLGELAAALKPFALPEGRGAAERVISTLGRSYRQPSRQAALVHVGPPAAPPRYSTPPPLPQLPAPPARQNPNPAKVYPLVLGLGGLALGASIALLVVQAVRPATESMGRTNNESHNEHAQLALQREIVREIASLRAAREDSSFRSNPAPELIAPKAARAPEPARERPRRRAEADAAKPKVAPESELPVTGSNADEAMRASKSASADHDLFNDIH